MSGRITLGVGSPYNLGRVTLLGVSALVYSSHENVEGGVTLGGGLSISTSI